MAARSIIALLMAAILWIGLQAMGLSSANAAEAVSEALPLNAQDRDWLAAHPVVRLGDDFVWPPFVFMDEKGVYSGISSGYIAAISKRLGIRIEPVPGLTWAQVLSKVKIGEIDVLPAVVRSKEREAFLNFTKPYITFPIVIATHRDGLSVDDLAGLAGRKVGVVRGYITNELLGREFPAINLVAFDSLAAGLEALESGKIDAFVDNLGAITYEARRLRLPNVKIAASTKYKFELSMGVRKDWPELVALLDKSLDAMSSQEKSAIENTWLAIEVHFGVEIRTILLWALPLGTAAAIVIAVVIVWNRRLNREITVREQVSAELRATGARLKLVLETAAEGIFGIDDQCRIIFANPAAVGMLGWPSPETILGQDSSHVFGHLLPNGSPRAEGFCSIRATLRDGETRRVDNESFTGPQGLMVPVEYIVAPLNVGGQVAGAVVAFHDITERRDMEASLKTSNAELEQFAYVVSHDLRQPLRMINSYAVLLKRRLGETLDDDGRECLHFLSDGASRMDQMLVSLLEYSRIGRTGEPMSAMSSRAAAEEALQFLAPEVTQAKAEITLGPDWPQVLASRNELTRLFQNLIGNAIKYRADDRPPVITLEVTPHAEGWRFSIADNGIGIGPDQFDLLFKVFQRLHAQGKYDGAGIGLAVSRKIVERHGGHIWVESAGEDTGCRFCFTLPKLPDASPGETKIHLAPINDTAETCF